MAEVEQLRKSLDQFCSLKIDDTNTDNIPDDLQIVVDKISSNGDMPYDLEWSQVSRIIRQRVLYCVAFMSEKRKYEGPHDEYEQTLKDILARIEIFDEPPFTIQRVCELLQTPDKHYKSTDKYMRAIQRNLLVVSGWRKYVDDEVPDTEPEKESCQEEESQAEPDSTSEPSTPAPHRSVSITHEVSYPDEATAENASPDSTTIEEKPEERSFLERPKKKIAEEEDDDAFDQLVKLKASPQRKVALGTSKIQINVGADFNKEVNEKPEDEAKPASNTSQSENEPQLPVASAEKMEDEQAEKPVMKVSESGDAPLSNAESSKAENKTDEKDQEAMSSDDKERKRKRDEADTEKSEEKDELEQPATPQKVQKTE